ncbi:DNA invertase Pin-like site-specific DNA recombinase [Geodermatophilus sabuli]|uniref:Recombinase n=1 Tax=Geodermatophilus sabuli TaxID=1564158 RepID=A0A285EG42_9ACTN|nr:DNA invertase Pin-like site-specific DNA recombinase [Geodermatophilus sabuli]SNX97947.1 Recombinase [Geodermatophilus sabuli]
MDNDTSASSGKARPAYTRMLADVEAGRVGAVVAWDLDRLHRRPVELEHFIDLADRHRLALATVGGNADLSTDNGRLFARIKGAVARGEIERKSARQKRANLQRAELGKPPAGGRRAVGYEPGGMELREFEAALIRDGYRHLLAGASLRGIAAQWNAAGFTTAVGGAWRPDGVRYTLRNPRNAAIVVHCGQEYGAGAWPAIVPEHTYRAAVALLDEPSRRTTPTTARRYLLAGLARCHCGAVVITGRTQHGQRTYRCGRSRGHLSRGAVPIDELVAALVVARLSRPDAAELLTVPGEGPDVGVLREEASALRARLGELSDLFADGAITAAQLARGTERARTRLDAIERQMADAGRIPVLGELVTADDVRATWDALDLDRRRAAIDTLMAVSLLPPGRGARRFDPETVRINWRTPE